MALTPRAWASRTTASASAWLVRALTTTWAPSDASFKTVARPIFRPDPVTSAILPSSFPTRHLPLQAGRTRVGGDCSGDATTRSKEGAPRLAHSASPLYPPHRPAEVSHGADQADPSHQRPGQ